PAPATDLPRPSRTSPVPPPAPLPLCAMERRAGIASIALGKFAGVTNRLLARLVHPDHVDGPIGDAVRAMALRVGSKAYLRQQRADRQSTRLNSSHVRTSYAVVCLA